MVIGGIEEVRKWKDLKCESVRLHWSHNQWGWENDKDITKKVENSGKYY